MVSFFWAQVFSTIQDIQGSIDVQSFFGLQMENYQGDLNDIVRASGGSMVCGSGASEALSSTWQHQFSSDPSNFSSPAAMENSFGDPFSAMRDPLLHQLDMVAGSTYFGGSPTSTDHHIINTSCSATIEDNPSNFNKIFEDDHIRSPCNIFSRIQISPSSSNKLPISPCDSPVTPAAAAAATGVSIGVGVSPRGINAKAPAVLPSDMINANSSKGFLIDNTAPLQISSPRNLGIKRRKSQAKKVVCIPAPAAANSRSSGEVVPSDLWAWRKYGQKPIKGSPYPRGYYRCSSSKGCSARKQVERSRNDPNMLVITYTSEHNHPWPTQRNALAGSTRSQPSKTNASGSKTSPPQISTKEEIKENSSTDALSPLVGNSSASASVKEEIDQQEMEKLHEDSEFGEGIPQTYKPALPELSHEQSEDFFADLDEIETDPMNILFPQGFAEEHDHEQKENNKAMEDPFSLFDWPSGGDDDNTSFL